MLVSLDDLFLELLGRALVRQHARNALPKVPATGTRPLRDVNHQPVRTRTDARVPDAAGDEVLAPMRSFGTAAGAGRRLHQLAGGGDLAGPRHMNRFESWQPYDRLAPGHGRSFILLRARFLSRVRPAPF